MYAPEKNNPGVHPSFRLLLLASVLLLFSGCAKKTMLVLMPSPDGSVGEIKISNEAGSRVLNKARHYVKVGKDAPGAPEPLKKEKIRKTFSGVMEREPAPPAVFRLFFESGSSRLTEESRKLLADIPRTAEERISRDISVVGHADSAGSEEYNYQLSLNRARAIAELLVRIGVDRAVIRISSHGEGNPLVPAGDNVAEPRNRRVEVTVR